MDGPGDCHVEWSGLGTERQISYDVAYMWNLKEGGRNELICKTEVESWM